MFSTCGLTKGVLVVVRGLLHDGFNQFRYASLLIVVNL